MACKLAFNKLLQGEKEFDITLGTDREYFDCGEYYFDGEFNVVKFPVETMFYHGSAILADNVVLFPTGINWTSLNQNSQVDTNNLTVIAANSQDTIEQLLSQQIPVSAGWFGDPATAKLYSEQNSALYKINCEDHCVFSYKLKKDAIFFLLTDTYNVQKLLTSFDNVVPQTIKQHVMDMTGYVVPPNPYKAKDGYPINPMNFNVDRKSETKNDIPFTNWFCSNSILSRYAGLASPWQKSSHHQNWRFHSEIIFCNPLNYLQRNYTDKLDWQTQPELELTTDIGKLVFNMKMYQTTNVNFHAGDLYEHSVWIALLTESYLSVVNTRYILQTGLAKIGVLAAFLHDIGKCQPQSRHVKFNPQRMRFIYFDIPDHPLVGYEYLTLEKPFPIVLPSNSDPSGIWQDQAVWDIPDNIMPNYVVGSALPSIINNQIFLKRLFDNMAYDQVSGDFIREVCAIVSKHHYDIGDFIMKPFNESITKDPNIITIGSIKIVNGILVTINSLNSVQSASKLVKLAIIELVAIISILDVKAAQPFCINCIKDKDNTGNLNFETQYYKNVLSPNRNITNSISQYWPFIVNVSKKYIGGQMFHAYHYEKYGKKVLDTLVDTATRIIEQSI